MQQNHHFLASFQAMFIVQHGHFVIVPFLSVQLVPMHACIALECSHYVYM